MILTILALAAGVVIRLAAPIIVTGMLVYVLRKLDARWQRQAQSEFPNAETSNCWKINGSIEEKKDNKSLNPSLPCWQSYRLPNGYLQEECMSCEVFLDAPVPTFKVDPRRSKA